MALREVLRRLEQIEDRQISKEHVMCVQEIEEWGKRCQERYNSPDEIHRREEWYAELQRSGEARKREFYKRLGIEGGIKC